MYYALSDKFTGDYPREASSGFANMKYVIAFSTQALRDEWVKETNLTTARALNKKEAIYYAEIDSNPCFYDKNLVVIWEGKGKWIRSVRFAKFIK